MAAKKPAPTKPATEGSISRAGFADEVDASRVHRTFKVLPSRIIARHSNNHDRAPVYSRAVELPELAEHPAFGNEDVFCFSRAEVLARADSFLRNGQEMAVRFDRTATGLCTLSAGYLRHAAALYLEVTGKLAECKPNGAGDKLADGLMGLAADAPKTVEGQIAAVWHSAAENERKPTTPIDLAWKIRRLTQLQVQMPEICERLGISASTATKHLRLLTLPVATQLAVHEGKVSYNQALADASKMGEGSATGPRPGLSRATIKRALAATEHRPPPSPKSKFTTDALALVRALQGEVDSSTPQHVAEFVEWLDAPADLRPPKKAALRPGKKVDEGSDA